MSVTPPPTGSSQAGLVAGHLLGGRYRLDDTLASGGMAQVWRGTDEVLRRAVAIKVLHPHLTSDDTFVARFRQEAIAVARLSHPAIVSVYDTCSENGVEAIVMELVTGSTLRQRLDSGPIDPQMAANIATQVAGALEMAHGAGLVHRDIKPANILISEDGRVKVGDFGIAKAAESSTELTQEGSFVGTAKYLAPEQIEGGQVDGRTDLYSLGVVLYEMLCGRAPFEADGSSATALARLHSDPKPLHQVRATVPDDLEAITLRLLARRPDDRYPDANRVRTALLNAGAEAGPHTTSDHTALPAMRPAAPARPTSQSGAALGSRPPNTPPSSDHTEVRFAESERRWLVPTLLVVLTAVSLAVVGLLIGRSGGGLGGGSGGNGDDVEAGNTVEPTQQSLVDIVQFDPPPDGDGEEESDMIGNLSDGDPETFWRTEGYHSVELGNLKDGVGFYVELEDAADVAAVELATESNDWNVEIYVADSAEDSVDDWGPAAGSGNGLSSGRSTIELDQPTEGKFVLVYFTRMGDVPVSGGYRVVVNDVQVLGG